MIFNIYRSDGLNAFLPFHRSENDFCVSEINSRLTPGVADGQGGLASNDSWGHKESDMTEQLN